MPTLNTDKREILFCQAVGDYCLHRDDPEVWETFRLDYSQKLGISRNIIDKEISARLSRSNNGRYSSNDKFVSSSNSYPVLSDKAKHGLAWEFVETVLPNTESDPAALLFQYVVIAGILMGRKAHYLVEGDRHFPNLSAVLVGDTSKGRKGTSASRVSQIFNPNLLEITARGLSSGEGLIAHLQDQKDAPPNDKRLLVMASEMARVLKVSRRDGNILSDVIRECFDSGNLRVMTRAEPLNVDGAHVGIIGHITCDELLRYLNDTEMANGFANRFMWICVKRSKVLPFGGDSDGEHISTIRRLTNDSIKKVPAESVTWEPKAAKQWAEVYKELSEGQPGLVGAMLGRAEAIVVRLALLQALINGERSIRVSDLEAATAMWSYCEQSVRYIFGTLTGDSLADRIYKVIEASERTSRTRISAALGRNVRAVEISSALNLLEDDGLIVSEEERVNANAKKPTTFYSLP